MLGFLVDLKISAVRKGAANDFSSFLGFSMIDELTRRF